MGCGASSSSGGGGGGGGGLKPADGQICPPCAPEPAPAIEHWLQPLATPQRRTQSLTTAGHCPSHLTKRFLLLAV